MKKRSESGAPEELRSGIMGLGDRSMRKSYFPELQDRLFELQRFRALLDEASDAILLVRAADRIIVDGNRAAWTLDGRRRDLRGRPLADFCPAVAARLEPGGATLERAIICHGDVHPGRPMELTVREVLFADEAFLVVVARDVTERLRAEADLRRAKEAAEAASRAKSEFLNLAAHELRTPLTTLKLLLARLRGAAVAAGGLDATGAGIFERLERQVRRLGDLATDLVDDLRLEQGTLTLRLAPVDLVSLVEEAVEVCRAELPGLGAELHGPPGPVTVHADPARLAQVLGELLENAHRFGAEAAPIAVRIEDLGPEVRVVVEDRGPGLGPEERARVFERLVRGRAESSRTQPGLGLGLHLARQIVELHGGRIGVDSEPGRGSRFWFVLPRAR